MAGIVQTDEPRARIVPRVFADVPTQAELDAVKKSRNGLAVWLVLLVGILIAAIAGLVFLYVTQGSQAFNQGAVDANLTTERADIISKLTALDAPEGVTVALPTAATPAGSLDEEIVALVRARDQRITSLMRDVEQRDEEIAGLEADVLGFSYYSPLQAQRAEAAKLKADIAAMLADPRWAGGLSQVNANDRRVYEEGIGPAWRDVAEANLTSYVETLQRVYDRIAAIAPPQGPRDPRPSSRGQVPIGDAEAGAGPAPQ